MRLIKLNWILISTFFVVNVFGDISFASAQKNEDEPERKIEIRKTVTIEDEGESIHLKNENSDGTVYEKSYASEEELKNDPALKGMDFHFGPTEGFLMETSEGQDGKFEVIIRGADGGETGKRTMMFKSNDGGIHEIQDGNIQWIEESDEADGMSNLFFMNDEGDTYKIIRNEDGEVQVEKNGVVMDIEELESDGRTKVDIEDDGTIIISKGDDNEQNFMIFKNGDGNNYTMDVSEDLIWEGDSMKNEFLFRMNNEQIFKDDNGNYTIKLDVESEVDGDGNHQVIIHKIIENIKIEILDVNNLNEISEVPGVLLNEGKDLGLEQVEYYPNPSSGQFTLRFKGKRKPLEVKILDLSGREIYNEKMTDFDGIYDNQIDLSENEPGLYVLQVIQNDKSWTKKILIE